MADYVFKLSLPFTPDPDPINSAAPRASVLNIARLLRRVATGNIAGASTFNAYTATTAASGTITFASVAADDTVTIGDQTFTAKVSPSGTNQFALGASDTAAAAALVVKINAHASLTGVVTATSALGVTTVTAEVGGLVGNGIRLASSNGTRAAVTGTGTLTSGASTRTSISF
jgi:hypothetical protein